MHLHPTYFATLFRRATGQSPLRFLVRYRIERARDLLLASDEPLGEIARRTGFYATRPTPSCAFPAAWRASPPAVIPLDRPEPVATGI